MIIDKNSRLVRFASQMSDKEIENGCDLVLGVISTISFIALIGGIVTAVCSILIWFVWFFSAALSIALFPNLFPMLGPHNLGGKERTIFQILAAFPVLGIALTVFLTFWSLKKLCIKIEVK